MTNSSSGGKSNRGGNDKQQQRRRKQPRQQQTKAAEAKATEAVMTNSSSGGKSNRGSNKRKQRRRQQPKQQQQLASTKGISDFNLGLAWNYRQARNIAGECLVVRNSATRRYLSLLFIESLYYFYLNMGLFHSRKNAQKGEIFRDPEPIASFFLRPKATKGRKGNVSDATNTVRQRTHGFARFRAELVQ